MGFFSNDYELSIGKNRISVKNIKDGICVTKIADEQFSSDTLLIARIRPFEAIVMHALKEARGNRNGGSQMLLFRHLTANSPSWKFCF